MRKLAPIPAVALLAAVGSLLCDPTLALEDRLGWHEEPLPDGLTRAGESGEYLWASDGSVMVYVPAGTFPMGSADGQLDETPLHDVHLDAYYIDKYEVSWRQWKVSGLPYQESSRSRLPEPKAPDWGIADGDPVVNVNWDFARRYSAWAGKRLPTEAQWEKAARGTDGRTYPWGDDAPTFDRAVWREHPTAQESVAAVDCCPAGASPYGAVNMAGNIYEWCEDVYHSDFYGRSPNENPHPDGDGRYRVLRGGAFVLELDDLRSSLRYRLLPQDRTAYIGFRTVLNVVRQESSK